ncbi:HesB/IscA family protein [Vibrio splendidus]|nr:iron-sulfur cluster assembly accessory protein [Vibrio splendidus]MCC4882984.1 iron-sulfur cluster assembly accessory protein [Vibrio splendidus]
MEFTVTDSAIAKIKEHIEDAKQEHESEVGFQFRLAINGGGCSGFKYDMVIEEIDDELEECYDHIIETDGVCIAIDMISATYLEGAMFDYESAFIGSGFKVTNPNAASTCGCGKSFSI